MSSPVLPSIATTRDAHSTWWRRLVGFVRRPRHAADARVDCVVDPDGVVLLFRIAGRATPGTISEIDRRTAALDARHSVHLDLHDATLTSNSVVAELERLADRLERALVGVRIVGIDPDLPALDGGS